MKQMLKIEIQRAFSGAAFKVSLIIGCLISILQFINVGIKHAMDNEILFLQWIRFSIYYS